MSSSTLPRLADLRKLAAAGASLSGVIALSDLPRLCEALVDADGELEVRLQLGADDEGYRTIAGSVGSILKLECQRCLEPVSLRVQVPVSLAMVWREDELASLPERFEGVIVGPEPSDLFTILEDEVLLALPLVAMHEGTGCAALGAKSPDGATEQAGSGEESPFAVLRALRPEKN